MKCRRAFDADVTAVVRGEGADPAFAAHATTCADCAAEVRVWRELDALLRAGAPVDDAHPEPETLVAFVEASSPLAAGARAEVERHLAACRICADEVGSLRRFDPRRVVAESDAPAAPAPVAASARERGGWFGRLVWHPAFAYAVVALLLVPLVREQLRRMPSDARVVDARRELQAPLAKPVAPGEVAPAPPPVAHRLEQPAAPAQSGAGAVVAGAERDMERRWAAPEGARLAPPATAKDAEGAPSLHDLAGELRPSADAARARAAAPSAPSTAAGAAAPAAPSPAPPTVIDVRSNAPAIVSAAAVARAVQLRITPPADFPSGPVDVHVRGRVGGHQLATRVSDRADAIAVRIPPGWLAPGDYVVTLTPAEGAAGATATLGFTVRAPTAAESGR